MARVFGVSEIEEIILHRLLMRLIDQVTESKDKLEGRLRKIEDDDPIINLDDKIRSDVLTIEICGQIAVVYALKDEKDKMILFGDIKDLEFLDDINLNDVRFMVKISGNKDQSFIEVINNKKVNLKGYISCKIVSKKLFNRIIERTKREKTTIKEYEKNIFNSLGFFNNLVFEYVSDDYIKSLVYLDEESPIVSGHFPKQPIMPGVFTLYSAIKTIQNAHNVKINRIKEFSFLSPIIPPSILDIKVEKKNGDYEVKVYANNSSSESAKGILKFK